MKDARFEFAKEGLHYGIRDRSNGAMVCRKPLPWEPHSTVDWGVITRLKDSKTGYPLLVAAGLDHYGTLEAGEFLTRPALLERALRQAPAGWRDRNLQILFRVEVVRDSVGVPTVTADVRLVILRQIDDMAGRVSRSGLQLSSGQSSRVPIRSIFAHQESCHHRRRPEPARAAAADADRPRRPGEVRPLHPGRAGPRGQRRRDLRRRLARRRGPLCAGAAGTLRGRLRFVAQPQPLGYGTRRLVRARFHRRRPLPAPGRRSLYVSPRGRSRRAQRLVELAEAEQCSVSAVQPTRESLLPHFGTVGGRRVPGRQGLYRVETVIEKPTPTEAEQRLMVPGMRAGYYLCFFGMHVLTPAVMELPGHAGARHAFPPRSAELARHEQYLALEERGPPLRYRRALRSAASPNWRWRSTGSDRAEVLAQMLELLADREMAPPREERPVSRLTGVITADDPEVRDRSLDSFCAASRRSMNCWPSAQALDRFRRTSDNLYERVRALFFLYAIHRFHIPLPAPAPHAPALIPFAGYTQSAEAALRGGHRHLPRRAGRGRPERRHLQRAGRRPTAPGLPDPGGPGAPQRALGARQPVDVPHRPSRRLSAAHPPRAAAAQRRRRLFPILREATPGPHGPDPQRLERHLLPRAWIFPKARACSISRSICAVRGAGPAQPEAAGGGLLPRDRRAGAAAHQRRSAGATAEITSIAEVFDFARDYLGLLKAAVIASGIVPPGMEGAAAAAVRPAGAADRPARATASKSSARSTTFPKGSRLAVSTNLLACLIAVCMRATGQIHALTGGLEEARPAAGGGARDSGRVARRLAAAAGRIPAASGPASS